MFKRIIVPIDGSIRAERAIPVAVRIMHASGGTIILLGVVNTPLEIGSQVVPLSGYVADTMEADIEAATGYLAALAGSEELDGIGVKMKALRGTAAVCITFPFSVYDETYNSKRVPTLLWMKASGSRFAS